MFGMAIAVRAAEAADRAAVTHMLGEFIEYLDAIEPSDQAPDLDNLMDQAFGPDPVCEVLIAERDGEPLGYLCYHPGIWEIYRALHVVSLFVRTTARGDGAGRILMEAAKTIAREQAPSAWSGRSGTRIPKRWISTAQLAAKCSKRICG
jgi:L-amino acid N-acyltransferase YncA